jgi:molecular chaperone HtpG
VVSSLHEYEGTPLQSVATRDLDLSALGGEAPKADEARASVEHGPLLDRMQAALKARASAVRVTNRLTDSPACLVVDEHGMSTNLERMLRAAGQDVHALKPILEINPSHLLVKRLSDETDEAKFHDWSHLLFDQATLAEGGHLDDPAAFVKRLNDVMLTLAGAGPSRIWTPGS